MVCEQIACASLSDYQVYYLSRQRSQGGGVALGVNKTLESTMEIKKLESEDCC